MKIFRVFVIIIICALTLFPTSTGVAFAATDIYSDVLEDLQKDEKFSKDDYPVNETNYSLKLIQIAESSEKELLVYVYQPCVSKDFKVSSIVFSTGLYTGLDYNTYGLVFINSSGALYKYKVKGFTVSNGESRTYSISQMLRPFDSAVDPAPSDTSQTVTETPIEVNEMFVFSTINGSEYVERRKIETVKVTEKHIGFVRYSSGVLFGVGATNTDCHYVAFNTSKPMDRLKRAKLYFSTRTYTELTSREYGSPENHTKWITENDPTVTSTKSGFFVEKYSWERIQTIKEFMASEQQTFVLYNGVFVNIKSNTDLTVEAKALLNSMSWVLRFYESTYQLDTSGVTSSGYMKISGTEVSDVMLLQLEFETDGVTYNLGVIDNKQSGSSLPDNESKLTVELSENFLDFLKIILFAVGAILLVVIGIVIFPYFVKFVGFILKIVFAPFKWLFGRSSVRQDSTKYKKRR